MMRYKPSLVLKPNDVILVIGNQLFFMQVYNVIGRTRLPMPFWKKYIFILDLYLQDDESVKKVIDEAKYLNQN